MTDREYLVMAYYEAVKSPDPSTQNGAVIPYSKYVPSQDNVSYGCDSSYHLEVKSYTSFPNGVKRTEDRLQRPIKYSYVEHAERNVIFEAAKIGIGLQGKTMYVPWTACAECARAIICSGIKKVVCHQRMMDQTPDHWKESIKHAFIMFEEAEIEIVRFTKELPEAPKVLINGKLWQP